MTTSAQGGTVTVGERFGRIYDRYPPGHLVSRSMRRAEPYLRRIVSAGSTGSMGRPRMRFR